MSLRTTSKQLEPRLLCLGFPPDPMPGFQLSDFGHLDAFPNMRSRKTFQKS